jgi:VIT1/CCC1 family predicted Fe2+/Mn2+ transporter
MDVLLAHGREGHAAGRSGWLRAAVLGANDGLVSTASLMVGVASSGAGSGAILTAGIAGVAAGSLAMATGEYVSVSSQSDVETADRARETAEHAASPEAERNELIDIYRTRGLGQPLAEQVVDALHSRDPIAAHLRDELGHSQHSQARPLQAALASASSFLLGGVVPFLGLLASGSTSRLVLIVVVTLLGLTGAGLLGARAAGGVLVRPTLRVLIGGGIAMLITAGVGSLTHVAGA